MSLRRVDARFLLPRAPRSATVLGGLEGWSRGLAATGIEVSGQRPKTHQPDLVVAPGRLLREALARRPRMLILEGRAPSSLRAGGWQVARYLPRPSTEEPALLLPLDQSAVATYAIDNWSVADRRWKLARRAVARELAARRALPALGGSVAVASRLAAAPFMVSAASTRLGLPGPLRWALMLGQGDALSRNVLHLFPAGSATPGWVVKFARVAGYAEPFERDQRGLELAAGAGPVVSARAPRLLGRFLEDGLHASVESAAIGRRLRELLQAPGDRAGKLARIDSVAEWIVELASATASPAEALEAERRRLEREVLPQWPLAPADLVADLPALPAVLQHNDLGTWNIICGDDGGFTALDWESARRYGLPLWDLLYFLADALAMLDGAWAGSERPRHTVRLFLGELASSQILFRWTRRAVAALDLPGGAIGSIATLCWLHHSLSHISRRAALDRFVGDPRSALHGAEGTAALWLGQPELRGGWTRWRAAQW